MAIIDFPELFDELKENVAALAEASFKTFAKDAQQDAQNLLESIKEKLTRWTTLLAQGKLTTDDFELLVTAQKDLVEMTALQKTGLAAIRIEQFRDSVINLVIDTVSHAIHI